jgi:thiol-disulfide isomerase/thioredoxin
MRPIVILPLIMLIVLAPMLALASGCLSHSTVIGPVQPEKSLPSPTLSAGKGTSAKGAATQGTPYALYWFFHTWCPSCQNQAGVIKTFQQRYGQDVRVYAVPLSGSDAEVKRFLSREGLGSLTIVREANTAFGAMQTHPVLVFRKGGSSYYRINGYTQFPELERLFTTFKRT